VNLLRVCLLLIAQSAKYVTFGEYEPGEYQYLSTIRKCTESTIERTPASRILGDIIFGEGNNMLHVFQATDCTWLVADAFGTVVYANRDENKARVYAAEHTATYTGRAYAADFGAEIERLSH
jgi:hypothetical protein